MERDSEEAVLTLQTPSVMESISCGLMLRVKNLILQPKETQMEKFTDSIFEIQVMLNHLLPIFQLLKLS